MSVKVGVGFGGWPFSDPDPGRLWEYVDACEVLGIDSIWLSDRIVSDVLNLEPLIALSIVYIGVENVMTERLTKRRAAVVFSFGLLHGLGFAGALRTLGLPQHEQFLGLVSFNVGIELGQLAVLTAALSTLGWWRRRGWYRSRLAVPLSLTIAAIGLVWTVERFFGA